MYVPIFSFLYKVWRPILFRACPGHLRRMHLEGGQTNKWTDGRTDGQTD
jgi:hypothetical protein